MCVSRTGLGHFQLEKTLKNLVTGATLLVRERYKVQLQYLPNVEGRALGYNWQIRAVNMAQETPPKNPTTLPYIPRADYVDVNMMYVNINHCTVPFAHSLIILKVIRKF